MPVDQYASTLKATPECELPELTPGAAQVLLRILRTARDRQPTGDGDPPEVRDERDIA